MVNYINLKTNQHTPITTKTNNKYWLTPSSQKIQNTQSRSNKYIKTKRESIIGASIGASILLASGLIFYVSKNRNIYSFVNNLRNKYSHELQLSKLANPNAPVINSTYLYMVKILDFIINRSKFINNYTSIKDTMFKKIMEHKYFGLNKFGIKLHKKITNIFEKLGRQSVINSYKKTYNSIKQTTELNNTFIANLEKNSNPDEIIAINNVSKSRKEWIEIIKNLNNKILSSYNSNFGNSALFERYKQFKNIVKNLPGEFSQLSKSIFQKSTITKFIADAKIEDKKKEIQRTVQTARNVITYSNEDYYKYCEDLIFKIVENIRYTDTASLKILSKIKTLLNDLNKNNTPDTKSQIYTRIDELLTEIKTTNPSAEKDEIIKTLDCLKTVLKNPQSGYMDKMLEIYEHLLDKDSYQMIKKAHTKARKTLDKSIKIETQDFIDKLRDLTLGSAPTDLLTILGGIFTLGYHIIKAKDNDERTSISLKYGFPAIAGIGTSLYFNAKLFSGSKSLFWGFLSMWGINRVGVYADKLRKKYCS